MTNEHDREWIRRSCREPFGFDVRMMDDGDGVLGGREADVRHTGHVDQRRQRGGRDHRRRRLRALRPLHHRGRRPVLAQHERTRRSGRFFPETVTTMPPAPQAAQRAAAADAGRQRRRGRRTKNEQRSEEHKKEARTYDSFTCAGRSTRPVSVRCSTSTTIPCSARRRRSSGRTFASRYKDQLIPIYQQYITLYEFYKR